MLGFGKGDGFAGFGDDGFDELGAAALDAGGDAQKQLRAIGAGAAARDLERAMRGGDGAIQVLRMVLSGALDLPSASVMPAVAGMKPNVIIKVEHRE